MITQEPIYLVFEYWLTDADWRDLHDRNAESNLHEDEYWHDEPQKSGPNMFAFTTKELANECIAMRKEAYKDHLKASEEHNWEECEEYHCTYCEDRRNEKTYSYEIKETNLIKEGDSNVKER